MGVYRKGPYSAWLLRHPNLLLVSIDYSFRHGVYSFSNTFLAKEENQVGPEEKHDPTAASQTTSETTKGVVPPGSLDLLCRLFPEKKRSVLELVLRRCEHDLLKAIEQCVPLCKNLTATPKSRKPSTGKYFTFLHVGVRQILNGHDFNQTRSKHLRPSVLLSCLGVCTVNHRWLIKTLGGSWPRDWHITYQNRLLRYFTILGESKYFACMRNK